MTSAPTYLGALQAWDAYESCYCTVDQDDDGILVDQIPRSSRSVGAPASSTSCRTSTIRGDDPSPRPAVKLAEIARRYDLILVEDDPYGELRFEGEEHHPDIPPRAGADDLHEHLLEDARAGDPPGMDRRAPRRSSPGSFKRSRERTCTPAPSYR